MIKRPASVTVIAWFLIVLGGISFISLTVMINDPLANEIMGKTPIPLYIQYALAYSGLAVMIVSGIAMIKGCNWARYLYTIWAGAGLLIGLAASPMKAILVPQIVVFAIVVLLLFRPTATAYFLQRRSSDDTQGV
jgi:hypothetical protein